jgi:hypothetical protein
MCVIYHCQFMVSENKMGPVIPVALIAQSTWTRTSRNSTLPNRMAFHAHQYVLFWEFTYPMWWNPASSPNRTYRRVIPPAYTPKRYEFTQVSLSFMICSVEFVLSYINANAAVLLHFVVMTWPFAAQISPEVCLEMYPITTSLIPFLHD